MHHSRTGQPGLQASIHVPYTSREPLPSYHSPEAQRHYQRIPPPSHSSYESNPSSNPPHQLPSTQSAFSSLHPTTSIKADRDLAAGSANSFGSRTDSVAGLTQDSTDTMSVQTLPHRQHFSNMNTAYQQLPSQHDMQPRSSYYAQSFGMPHPLYAYPAYSVPQYSAQMSQNYATAPGSGMMMASHSQHHSFNSSPQSMHASMPMSAASLSGLETSPRSKMEPPSPVDSKTSMYYGRNRSPQLGAEPIPRGEPTTAAAPGPIPATTPLVVRQDQDGVQWIRFEYSRDRIKHQYTIRCDVESVDTDSLSKEFKTANCVYPRAFVDQEQYGGNRWNYETECNAVGWSLAKLNSCLQEKRGLIQRAVDSWRNSNQDPKLRSRRVRRMNKQKAQSSRRDRPHSGSLASSVQMPLPTPQPHSMDAFRAQSHFASAHGMHMGVNQHMVSSPQVMPGMHYTM